MPERCYKAPLRWIAVAAAALVMAHASPAAAGNAQAGKAKTRVCIACHGVDGRSLRPDAPHLSGQNELYTAAQLRAYRDGRRRHPVMSIVAAPLSDSDIDDLAAWYASIKITVTVPE